MDQWTTLTIVSSTVAPAGSVTINSTISSNIIRIGKVKVVPTYVGGSADFGLYKRSTCLSTDAAYRAVGFASTLSDPVEQIGSTQTERNEGYLAHYEDLDAGKNLHIKITNNGFISNSYTITIKYYVPLIYDATTGALFLKLTTSAPADAALSANELVVWTNDSNALNFKYKTTAGAIKTGTIALS